MPGRRRSPGCTGTWTWSVPPQRVRTRQPPARARRVEAMLGLAGAGVVEDALTRANIPAAGAVQGRAGVIWKPEGMSARG
jgi:hypothetical protein